MSTPTLKVLRGSGHYERPRSVVRELATQWGNTPGTVGQKLHGNGKLADQVIDVIHACRRARQEGVLLRFMQPILDAWQRTEAPPLVPATWQLAQEADAQENVVELAYQLDPSEKNRDRLIQAKDRAILREIALRDALLASRK